ncbi:MAG: protein kinase [Planctomycetes bacterium]|nr:protein kinase [Planctomycetota bacterium]
MSTPLNGERAAAAAYARTVPAESFSPSGVRDAAAAADALGPLPLQAKPADAPEHTLRGVSLTRRLLEYGYTSRRPAAERFEVRSMLGAGANGDVFSVEDNNLKREIAVKFLKGAASPDAQEIEQFIDEAQITASLQHPNVLPVYEIDVNERGRVYFTMKKIDGRSLGDVLALSTPERRDTRIATSNQLVSIVVSLGHALAYAHHRGIVHQDIKPDNVMLGDFGEILLVDWGSACQVSDPHPRLFGTPLYMSPEQARLERSDPSSDIWCLGATLFHALTLRPPMWSDDADAFWRRKRGGEIDPPTDAERSAVPAPLLDIAMKAMAPERAQRYASVEALVHDLEQYQAGLAVSAHRDSLREKLARWYRRNARMFWSLSAAGLVTVALVATLYGEKIKEISTWGSPVLVEDFSDDGWQARWKTALGGFVRREGRLVSTSDLESLLLFPVRLLGDAAIEYDCQVLPGAHTGDLSMFYARECDFDIVHLPEESGFDAYRLLFGGFGGTQTAMTGPGNVILARHDLVPVPGRTYHVRVEISGRRISCMIDGAVVAEHEDPLPFTSGYLMLYAYFKDHAFDNVRIYSRGIAQKVSATAIGDAFLQERQYAQAAAHYAKVHASHPEKPLAQEARFKQGLSQFLSGDLAAALTIWDNMPPGAWDDDIALRRLEILYQQKRHDQVVSGLEDIFARSGPAMRKRIVIQWMLFVGPLASKATYLGQSTDGLLRYIDLQDRLFPGERLADRTTADALLALSRMEEVLVRFPTERKARQNALAGLQRYEQLLEEFPDDRDIVIEALTRLGRSNEIAGRLAGEEEPIYGQVVRGEVDRVLAQHPTSHWAWLAVGRLDEILADPKAHSEMRRRAALLSGRLDALPAAHQDHPLTLIASGRIHEALARWQGIPRHEHVVRQAAGLEAAIAGHAAQALDLLDMEPREIQPVNPFALGRAAMVPFVRQLMGDVGAVERSCRQIIAERRYDHEQHLWSDASCIAGSIDDAAFLAQPHRLCAPADLLLCRAVRAELADRATDALADYRAFVALPRWRRCLDLDPVCERFAHWRIEVLAPR